jgi:hypothetical protein
MRLKDRLRAFTDRTRQALPGELGYYMHASVIEAGMPEQVIGVEHIDSTKMVTLKTPAGDVICLKFERV